MGRSLFTLHFFSTNIPNRRFVKNVETMTTKEYSLDSNEITANRRTETAFSAEVKKATMTNPFRLMTASLARDTRWLKKMVVEAVTVVTPDDISLQRMNQSIKNVQFNGFLLFSR